MTRAAALESLAEAATSHGVDADGLRFWAAGYRKIAPDTAAWLDGIAAAIEALAEAEP